MRTPEQAPNPEIPSSVNPDFISYLNEKAQQNKVFEDMIASNYEAHEIPVAAPSDATEKSVRNKSLRRKIGECAFALLGVYTTAGQLLDNVTEPAYELTTPVTVEAPSSYADADILAQHTQDKSKKSGPIEMLAGGIPPQHIQGVSEKSHLIDIEMPAEDIFDITRPVKLKPAKLPQIHTGQWMKGKRGRLPKMAQKAVSH